jgi:hypothetical protein
MHRVDNYLFHDVEVGKSRQLRVSGRKILDEILASIGSSEVTILFSQFTMLSVCPNLKCWAGHLFSVISMQENYLPP